MSKVLVTGVNGFVGKHLVRALVDKGFSVSGIVQKARLHPEISHLVDSFYVCDLTDQPQVDKLDFSSYLAIINLAGLANVGQSFKNPELYMTVNVDVLSNICQSTINQKASPRIVAISTGAVYDSHQSMPLTEDSKLVESGSPYAMSKLAMEKAAQKFIEAGLDCVIARPFNHIGPGQLPGFLVPDLIAQVRSVINNHKVMKVGTLTTKRDYTDVRDVVEAYTKLATAKLNHNLYNICSGQSRSGEELLKMITAEVAPAQHIDLQVDPSLVRPDDPPNIYGSSGWLKSDTGWQPLIPIQKTIKDACNTKT